MLVIFKCLPISSMEFQRKENSSSMYRLFNCVKKDFIVPINDLNWPKDPWGLRLGDIVSRLRDKVEPEQRFELDKLGFVWNFNECLPSEFDVPVNDPNWPEETWNLKL
ncbi:hypothetical protein THRCLA_23090, partial [Thraustotheca clavata]